ncbi:ParB/RepB/Spo0J family partition protein [Sphingomonas sp. 8AM]|uniref:ParB/RepB/Spo0J family partition protein n=1 Tax=Sphingomonas sp. 8AM TaxID=2653170 RepID=UPI0012F3EF34|nr:ParB/RepB/Spo0J family partition protein [Sphingomonas sp. 8AM]VXD00182.1 ParB/RepB/Spo0J family partition protein [Sphingomonas sp. 8AM]
MARKQSDYLAALLADEPAGAEGAPAPPAPRDAPPERARATTLLGRESALARVASGEVRQVTQLLLDPARVRIWPGNARSYTHLSEANCRELIDSIIAEGGQKVPAVVRRVDGDPDHDFEVIAGTRRHWSISWLRAHSYPDMQFVAQVAQLDDEAAFRLADLENRARADVSDLERARNYLDALKTHYGNHQTRMAERLKLSKGWLSKMLKVATIPDAVIAAFASPSDVQLKPAYALAQALDDKEAAKAIGAVARELAREQARLREGGALPCPAPEVLRRLIEAPKVQAGKEQAEPYRYATKYGRTALTVQSANRQGVTIRLHAGSGADTDELVSALRDALAHLDATGKGLRP